MKPVGMTFFSVTALSARAAAVVTMPEAETEDCEGEVSSSVSVSTPDGWVILPPVPWFTVACLVTENAPVGVGQHGHLQHLPWAGGETRVTKLPTAPALPLWVQGARRVGDRFYVCGMERQVFVSPDGTNWATMNEGLETGLDEPVTSVSNLAGDGASLVAVGVQGAVFRRDGTGPWQRLESGVRSWLKDVAWHEGAYWICGRNGLLLTGDGRSPDGVARIDTGTRETLLTLTSFQDRLYALGEHSLFRLDGTSLVAVPTPETPRAMDACADALWIATQDGLFVSPDGEHFTAAG